MIETKDLLLGGLLPLAAALIASAAVARLMQNGRAGWLLGFLVGYLAGHVGLGSRNGDDVAFSVGLEKLQSPLEARDWLPMLVGLTGACGLIALAAHGRRWLELLVAVGACSFVPWRLLRASVYANQQLRDAGLSSEGWTAEQTLQIGGIAAALMWLCWALGSTANPDDSPRWRSCLAIFFSTLTAAVLALSGAIVYGQLLGVVAAALAGCLAGNLLARKRDGPEGAAGPVTVAIGGLLLMSTAFSSLAPTRAGFLAIIWLIAIGKAPEGLRDNAKGGWIVASRAMACTLALAGLVGLAVSEFTAKNADTGSVEESTDEASYYEQYK